MAGQCSFIQKQGFPLGSLIWWLPLGVIKFLRMVFILKHSKEIILEVGFSSENLSLISFHHLRYASLLSGLCWSQFHPFLWMLCLFSMTSLIKSCFWDGSCVCY